MERLHAGQSSTGTDASDPSAHRLEYVTQRKLLFGALARLAREGYAVGPDDGMDLIHDFYVEEWSTVVSKYDPTRAKFNTFLYTCFVGFARPRIIRLSRWQAALMPPDELGRGADGRAEQLAEPSHQGIDVTALRNATAKLSPFARTLLAAYLSEAAPTERDLAREYSLSRHQLRSRLADALGQTAVNLGEYSSFSEPDRAIVFAVWRDGRSIRETANLLRLPTTEIQAARMRVYKRLVAATKGIRALSVNKSYGLMAPESSPSGPTGAEMEQMLLRVTGPGRTEADAAELRENADVVIAYLENPRSTAFLARHRDAMAGEGLAALYGALSDCIEDTEESEALLAIAADEERTIGEAFAQALLPNLPARLNDPAASAFAGAPRLQGEERALLLQDVSVSSGGPAAARLATYGLTPVSVAEAAQAIANAARRACKRGRVGSGEHIILERASLPSVASDASERALRRADAIREVAATTELPGEASSRLVDWLSSVAEYVPGIFPGFETGLHGGELCLTPTLATEQDPFVQWGPAARSAAA